MADTPAKPKPRTQVKVQDPAAERLLAAALKQRARGRTELVKLTPADAVALTGMPSEQAQPALKSLVATYRSHVAVTEDGFEVLTLSAGVQPAPAIGSEATSK